MRVSKHPYFKHFLADIYIQAQWIRLFPGAKLSLVTRIYFIFIFSKLTPRSDSRKTSFPSTLKSRVVEAKKKDENKDDRDRRGTLGPRDPLNVLTTFFRYPPPQPFALPQAVFALFL